MTNGKHARLLSPTPDSAADYPRDLAAWALALSLPRTTGLRSCIRRKEAAPEAKKPLQAAAIAALSRRCGSKSARADEA